MTIFVSNHLGLVRGTFPVEFLNSGTGARPRNLQLMLLPLRPSNAEACFVEISRRLFETARPSLEEHKIDDFVASSQKMGYKNCPNSSPIIREIAILRQRELLSPNQAFPPVLIYL